MGCSDEFTNSEQFQENDGLCARRHVLHMGYVWLVSFHALSQMPVEEKHTSPAADAFPYRF